MTDTNVSSLVLKKGSNRYIFDPSGNLDLSNYYTKSEVDGKYALKSHTHAISEITNLQSTLDGKAASNHTHSQYATTTAVTTAQNTANNALNVANGKLANINTKYFYVRPAAGTSYNDSSYANKNLHVSHPCLLQLNSSCYEGDDDNKSITVNGVEIYSHGYHERSDTHSYGGINYTIPIYCTTSDVIKVTGRYMGQRQFYIGMYAAGTNAFLHA